MSKPATTPKPPKLPKPAAPAPLNPKCPHANLDGLFNLIKCRVTLTGNEWDAVNAGVDLIRAALLALAVLALPSCQCLRDHYDLWFVVPRNPFPSTQTTTP